MIIKTHDEENKIVLELTNSHLEAFRGIMKRWNLKDEACLVNFMMGVMLATKTNQIGIEEELGERWVTVPDHFLKS